ALGLFFLPANMSESARRSIQTGLGLIMGLVIVCLGFYLLLLRLSGRADHIHIGGGHHHHHQHSHHGETAASTSVPRKVSIWGLILLGMSGGLVPCTDAIAMLVLAVGMNLFWLAFPLLLAFSAGLAGVLSASGFSWSRSGDLPARAGGEAGLGGPCPFIAPWWVPPWVSCDATTE